MAFLLKNTLQAGIKLGANKQVNKISKIQFYTLLLYIILFNFLFQLLNAARINKLNVNQARNYLLLHEYVSMGILKEYDIKVPKFQVASSPKEVKEVVESGGLKRFLLFHFHNTNSNECMI